MEFNHRRFTRFTQLKQQLKLLLKPMLVAFIFTMGCSKSSNSPGAYPASPSQVPNEVAQKVADKSKLPY